MDRAVRMRNSPIILSDKPRSSLMNVTVITGKGGAQEQVPNDVEPSRISRFISESRAMKAIGPLKPVSCTTFSEHVAPQFAAEVAAKRWRPVDKLPFEAESCRAFDVGRSTLHQALKSLAFIGTILMRAENGSCSPKTSSALKKTSPIFPRSAWYWNQNRLLHARGVLLVAIWRRWKT
jgi:hypothetical protein